MFSKLDSGNKFYSKKMFANNDGKVNTSKREVPKVLFELNIGDKQKRAAADLKIKWQHTPNKPEQIKRVKNLCEQVFGKDSLGHLFDSD